MRYIYCQVMSIGQAINFARYLSLFIKNIMVFIAMHFENRYFADMAIMQTIHLLIQELKK